MIRPTCSTGDVWCCRMRTGQSLIQGMFFLKCFLKTTNLLCCDCTIVIGVCRYRAYVCWHRQYTWAERSMLSAEVFVTRDRKSTQNWTCCHDSLALMSRWYILCPSVCCLLCTCVFSVVFCCGARFFKRACMFVMVEQFLKKRIKPMWFQSVRWGWSQSSFKILLK